MTSSIIFICDCIYRATKLIGVNLLKKKATKMIDYDQLERNEIIWPIKFRKSMLG